MCEYLRPVVALEWLKACCTDMITWMSSFSYEETLNTMTARRAQESIKSSNRKRFSRNELL